MIHFTLKCTPIRILQRLQRLYTGPPRIPASSSMKTTQCSITFNQTPMLIGILVLEKEKENSIFKITTNIHYTQTTSTWRIWNKEVEQYNSARMDSSPSSLPKMLALPLKWWLYTLEKEARIFSSLRNLERSKYPSLQLCKWLTSSTWELSLINTPHN